MKRGEMINRAIAAIITIGFMAAVRPDADPERWGVALVAVMLYEAISRSIDYVQKVNRKQKAEAYISLNLKAMKEDGERLDDMVFNSIREVF